MIAIMMPDNLDSALLYSLGCFPLVNRFERHVNAKSMPSHRSRIARLRLMTTTIVEAAVARQFYLDANAGTNIAIAFDIGG